MGCGIPAQRIGGELLMDYLTNDTDLTAVADAIREKGGASAALVWPSGYVDAIDAIKTGGGGTVETAHVVVESMADHGYYTDANMTMQDSTMVDDDLPIGTLFVLVYSIFMPEGDPTGLTLVRQVADTAKNATLIYEVTG